MSAQLAHWLTEHRADLLADWVAAVGALRPENGSPFLPAESSGDGEVALQTQPQVATQIEQVFDDLVQAAHGDPGALQHRLHTIARHERDNAERTMSLPTLLHMAFHLRRVAWKLLRNNTEQQHMFALMDDLETLLETTIESISGAWLATVNSTMQEQLEEVNFLTESMGTAMEQADRAAVNLSALNEVAQRLSASLESTDLSQIVALVGDKLQELLQPEHIAIWLPDEPEQPDLPPPGLSVFHAWGDSAEALHGIYLPITTATAPPYEDLVLRAYMLSETILERHPLDDTAAAQQGGWYQAGTGVVAVPLLVQEQARGIVLLQDANPLDCFAPERLELVVAIVSQMAIALENFRLYEEIRGFNVNLEQLVHQRTAELEAEKERLSTLHEIASEISSTLDLDVLLMTSLRALAHITDVRYGSIMMMDHETEQLVNRAVLGRTDMDTYTRFPLGSGVAGWVAQHKKPALVPDVHQDERWVDMPNQELTAKRGGSMLAVPLIAHQSILGVLTLSHQQVGYFNEDHLRLLTASAGAIAIGIHNANLYTTIVADMDHRSDLVRQLRNETTQINAILQSLSDGVVVCDTEGAILSVNPAATILLGKPAEELIIQDLGAILKGLLGSKRVDELPVVDLLDHPIGSNHQPRMFETTIQIGMRVINLKLGPVLKEDEELLGAILNMRDMTREVQSDRLKTEFIGTMSHELRTPMTAIKGFTQLLGMGSLGPLNDTQREFMSTIQYNAERMIAIINDVLELTKIETGSIELEIRPLHLAEALSGVVSELRDLANRREQELTITIPPGLPLVRADSSRLHQILFNLISNAVKYTPHGGKVWVEATEATLEDLPQHIRDNLLLDRRYTQIEVRDTGVGIAPDEVDKVFERFYRTENPLKVEAGGTGLGLSLTRPLVELLGGQVWATSELDVGSTFTLVLPAVVTN